MLSRQVSSFLRLALAILSLVCAAAASAQDQPLENRLPAKTTFYVAWHGSKPLDAARSTNSFLKLWDDPDFANARAAMVAEMFSSVPKDKQEKIPLSREEVTALLQNPFVVGAIMKPGAFAPPSKTGKPNEDVDFFLIYERTGKEAILARLMDMEKTQTPVPTITKTTFHDSEIETVVSGEKKNTYYRSAAGRYLVVCQHRELLEELLTRLASPAPPAESLAGSLEHRAARESSQPGDALSFYFGLKGLMTGIKSAASAGGTAGPNAANAATVDAMFRSLRLDRLESMSYVLTFDGPATHARFAIRGDLSQGGLTDIIGAGAPEFSTLGAVPASAAGYTSMRVDVSAFYRVMRETISAMAPAGQPNPADQMESAVSAQIGMTLPEMMKLLSGEFATVELEPSLDFSEKVFLLSIDKPDDVLHLLRALMTDSITNEEQAGAVTYLAFLAPAAPKKAGTAAPSRKFWYLAVGPHLLVVAPKKAMARETMARFEKADPAGSLASDPRFMAARSHLPHNLSGLSYTDLSKIDWSKLQKQIEDLTQSAASEAATTPNDSTQSQNQKEVAKVLSEMWKRLPLQSISKYVHSSYGGWWKDKHGVYFDSYME